MFTRRSGILLCLLVLLLTIYGTALAQTPPVPVTIGTPQLGEVSASSPAPRFSFTIDTAQTMTVQALAVIPGFVPSFNVYDPSGALLQAVPNPTSVGIVEASINFAAPGTYTVEVLSVTGNPGPFVLSVIGIPPAAGSGSQPPAPSPVPPAGAGAIPLPLSQAVPGSINPQAPSQRYTFSNSATDVLVLTVRSASPISGQIVTLRDAATGATLAQSGAQLISVRLNIPMALNAFLNYEVEVAHGGSAAPESFIVCLEPETNQSACPGGSVTGSPAPAATNAPPPAPAGCMVVANQNVNVRSGPHVNFNVVETLFSGSSTPVNGRTADNAWFQITVDNRTGWVAAAVVSVQGDCSTAPVIAAPQPPPPPAAPVPTATTGVENPPAPGNGKPTEEAVPATQEVLATEEAPSPNGTEEV